MSLVEVVQGFGIVSREDALGEAMFFFGMSGEMFSPFWGVCTPVRVFMES